MPCFRTTVRASLLLLFLLAVCSSAQAQKLPLLNLDGADDGGNEEKVDPAQLQQSLDSIIRTLEDSERRGELVEELKALRQSTQAAEQEQAEEGDVIEGRGLLNALANSFTNLSEDSDAEQKLLSIWKHRSHHAYMDASILLQSISHERLLQSVAETALGLLIWAVLIAALKKLGRRLFTRRDWPLYLPHEPPIGILALHFLRRVLPWLLAFIIMLFALLWLYPPPLVRIVVLVLAYVTLCGSLLAAVVEGVTALFTSGHRRTAVAIIHHNALRPLTIIGALVAFSDAVVGRRLSLALGANLASWLAAAASVVAGLLVVWLILRIRRPMMHLIGNRPYEQRRVQNTAYNMVQLLARLWYVPALFFVATPLAAILNTGTQTTGALLKAIVCAILLVLTLMVGSVFRRNRENIPQNQRRNEYRPRLLRFGYSLAYYLIWVLFVELSLRIWGLSLLTLGEKSRFAALVSRVLLELGITILLAWLAWVLIDTAILRALNPRHAHGQRRANIRAQTMTPMLRNVAFFTILLIAGIAALSNLGVNITPLLAGAGVIGLAIGFGAQTLVQDLITGIFILIEDSLAVGDFVEIRGHMGTVEGLNLRTVRLRDLDGIVHIITFSHIDSIHNMSREFGTALMKIRLPHDLPIDDAIKLMKETAEQLRKDPFIRFRIWSPLEMQGIHSFEDGCPILRMRFRTAPEYQWDVARAFNLLLKRRMEEQFISLGAPRLTIDMESRGGRHFDGRGRDMGRDSTEGFTHGTGPSPDPG